MLALLHDDGLRPSALGPEPVLGSRPYQTPVASPGGALAGPSGPLGAMTQGPGGQPLYQSAPQLRPLYETDGSNGLPPIKQPELPMRGPTPISMSAVNELMGAPPPPPAPKPATLPPPLRGKPPSMAPPMPPIPRPTGSTAPPPIGNRTMMGNAVLPPITVPAVIPPIPGPPPVTTSTLAGPPGMILPTTRPETEDDERIETVDFEKQDAFDAAATAARDPDPAEGSSSIMPIDSSMLVAGDSTSPSVPFETATNESPAFTEDLETVARDKIEARPSAPVLTSAARQTPPPAKTPTGASPLIKVPMPAPGAKAKLATPAPIPIPAPPPAVSQSQQIKVPISTAPESLPPPKEAKPTTIGPSPACPQCEAPMAWVEEHLRFYCKSCRMYF